ncbi:hypothetical protein KEM48_003082 [Puccinia striiformis f. sp. tritici PST-130]|nr:hypothetical protein KEM48_003082 [Puccinia striiformis f. sp. tritici PST-130]
MTEKQDQNAYNAVILDPFKRASRKRQESNRCIPQNPLRVRFHSGCIRDECEKISETVLLWLKSLMTLKLSRFTSKM